MIRLCSVGLIYKTVSKTLRTFLHFFQNPKTLLFTFLVVAHFFSNTAKSVKLSTVGGRVFPVTDPPDCSEQSAGLCDLGLTT